MHTTSTLSPRLLPATGYIQLSTLFYHSTGIDHARKTIGTMERSYFKVSWVDLKFNLVRFRGKKVRTEFEWFTWIYLLSHRHSSQNQNISCARVSSVEECIDWKGIKSWGDTFDNEWFREEWIWRMGGFGIAHTLSYIVEKTGTTCGGCIWLGYCARI